MGDYICILCIHIYVYVYIYTSPIYLPTFLSMCIGGKKVRKHTYLTGLTSNNGLLYRSLYLCTSYFLSFQVST